MFKLNSGVSLCLPSWRHFAAILFLAGGSLGTAASSTSSGFTTQQAQQGVGVYSANCSSCHGSTLKGVSAPALIGSKFASSITSRFNTAGKLFDYVSSQMPVNNPGSLSKAQYQQVVAFVLAQNGYAPAAAATQINAVKLTPYPVAAQGVKKPGATNLEIQNSGTTSTVVTGTLPTAANVTVTNQMMLDATQNDSDWLLHGRDYTNQRYSTLTQINVDTVKTLAPVALVQTSMTGSFETTPIVVGGVMYATTPVVDNKMKILAINAATGESLWQTNYSIGEHKICCGPVNRGLALGYGMVYFVTLDDHLVAFDAANGKLKWSSQVADPSVGYSETMAPQIYKGTVIIGSAGGEWPIRGYVASYDAKTGHQLWRWQSTDPKTYEGDSWKHGGGMVWTTPAIDTERNLIIFSTGNPNPDLYGDSRKGDNLYTDSIVALNAGSGTLAWYYQEIKHDVWDYDAVSNVVLFDVNVNGKSVPAAGEAGKNGWFYIVDRRDGSLIQKSEPFVMQSKNMYSLPTKTGVVMLPGANGGAEWSPPAYSPLTKNVYIMGMNQLMNFATHQPPLQVGDIRLGSAFTNVKKQGIQNGTFTAINVDTGKITWQYTAPQPLIGGVLATAGNLVFMGEGNGYFDAFNATTGEKVWRFNLGAGVNAPPITYTVGGEQYIAVAAGGNFQLGFPLGDTIAIFKLSK